MPTASDIATRQTSFSNQAGFTIVQMLITIAIVTIVSAFALFAIDSTRASVRLTGSTREFAGYLEKARSNAIRRNGTSEVTILNQNSYSVTMDFDGDGSVETRTINLQSGVTFPAGHVGITAQFDWRGRVPAQIGFELHSNCCQPSTIHVSGAGDVTIGSESFQDNEIGEITLHSTPPTEVVGTPGASPIEGSDNPSPGEGDESPPSDGDGSPSGDGDGDGSPSGDGDGDAPPSGDGDGDGSPSGDGGDGSGGDGSGSTGGSGEGSATPCVLSAPATLSLPKNGSPKTFSVVTITNANNTVITAGRTGHISSVSPASTTLSGNGTISYTIVYASGTGRSGTVSLSSPCGNKTIAITFD